MPSHNLFLMSVRENHAKTVTSEFRHRFGARSGDAAILFYDWDGSDIVDPDAFDFPVLSPEAAQALGPGDVRSVILISLTPKNAAALTELEGRTALDMSRVCVFVTDDEIQRWSDHLATHGRWTPDVQEHIDAVMIGLLGRIRKFFCPYEPFGRLLEGILGAEIEIIDVPSLPPVVTDPVVNQVMVERVRPAIEAHVRRTRATNVMVMTKPRPWPAWREHMLSLLRFLASGKGRRMFVVHVWRRRAPWPWGHRVQLVAVLVAVHVLGLVNRLRGGPRAEIRFIPSIAREEYLMLIFRCHVLIGAARSGGGAMAEFLRQQKLAFFPAGSVNALVNQRSRGIDTPETGPDVFARIDAMVGDGRAVRFGVDAAQKIRAVEDSARTRFQRHIREGLWGVGADEAA